MYKDVAADYWNRSNDGKESKNVQCILCPNNCIVTDGRSGKCGVRTNKDGKLIAAAYGLITSVALDPIEKKPLYQFQRGKKIVSIGSIGCNFHCPFCQNYNISMEYKNIVEEYAEPEQILDIANRSVPFGNVGVAYTYNEPLINYEYVKKCSKLVKAEGLMNVLVTNGYINIEPLKELLPLIDAMNIDIKGDNEGTYNMVGGTLDSVLSVVEEANKSCHVEVTTLVIPGENEQSIEEIAKWLAKVDKKIPYHLSRFFPRYKYSGRVETPPQTMYKLRDMAEQYLDSVYLGNM